MRFIIKHRNGTIKEYDGVTFINCSQGIWSLFQGKQLLAVLDRLDTIDLDVPAKTVARGWED